VKNPNGRPCRGASSAQSKSIPTAPAATRAQITEEVLQHLSTLPGSKLKVTVEIEADIPEGVSEDVQENCQTLRFRIYEFE
jgi:hypothetical protein